MTSHSRRPPQGRSAGHGATAPRIWMRDPAGNLAPYFETAAAESAGIEGSYVLERRVIEAGSLAAHTFDEHILMVPLSQRAIRFESRLDGRVVTGDIVPGGLRFLARGDSLATTWHAVIDALFLTLSSLQVTQLLGDLTEGCPIQFESRVAPHQDEVLVHLLCALQAFGRGDRQNGRLFEQSLLTAIARRIFMDYAAGRRRRSTGPSLPAWKMRNLKDYIHANIAGTFSLQDLADLAGMSPYHLARAFRASTGNSLWRYVLECRAMHALQCIGKSPEWTLADVAAACGFESYSQFVTIFRRFHGILPSEYRRSMGQK